MLSILVSIVVLLMLLAVIVLVAILVTWGVVKSRPERQDPESTNSRGSV